MDAKAYLNSLGIELVEAVQPVIGRLALAGEFVLNGARGVLLRPKRSDVSARYLELLAGQGYEFVIVDGVGYPSFYAREGESLSPIRALPVADPQNFPSEEILAAWVHLIRSAAGSGDSASLGIAQLILRLDDDECWGPDIVLTSGDVPVSRIGGNKSVSTEPLRTAAALLAGFRIRPEMPDELIRLLVALSSLLVSRGRFAGLTEIVAPLVQAGQLGTRRLVVSGGAGAEVAALFGTEGEIVLPNELHVFAPLLERLLPGVERVFADFLQWTFERPFDGAVVVPPVGQHLNGAQFRQFELAKRGGRVRARVAAELLFVEHALAAMAKGGLLVTVLPEGLLSSVGHADFREWLLKHARLLAVVSLPAGFCFGATGVKCSVVLLRKPAPAGDYPILMVDVDAENLIDDVANAKSKLEEFLEREVATCA